VTVLPVGVERHEGRAPSRARRLLTWRTWYLPLALFLAVAFVVPQLYFYRLAFAEPLGPGLVDTDVFTWDNLTRILGDSFWIEVIVRTLVFSALVTAVCLLLGFPLAYVISRSRFRSPLTSLVIITSFTGVIIKILGWRVLLGDNGPVNRVLTSLHIVDEPVRLVNNLTGAVIGTAHAVLPFMVLLLIPVLDQVPRQLEDAAAGLGSSRTKVYLQVVLPSCRAGLIGGALVTFAYSMGSFTTPALLGGREALILPLAIREQFSTTANYAFAAALALILMVIVLVISGVATAAGSRGDSDTKGS
jgi:putative spermidine/putrescine transport system permease protein